MLQRGRSAASPAQQGRPDACPGAPGRSPARRPGPRPPGLLLPRRTHARGRQVRSGQIPQGRGEAKVPDRPVRYLSSPHREGLTRGSRQPHVRTFNRRPGQSRRGPGVPQAVRKRSRTAGRLTARIPSRRSSSPRKASSCCCLAAAARALLHRPDVPTEKGTGTERAHDAHRCECSCSLIGRSPQDGPDEQRDQHGAQDYAAPDEPDSV